MYKIGYDDKAAEIFYEQYKTKIQEVLKNTIETLDSAHPDFIYRKLTLENLYKDNKDYLNRLITTQPKYHDHIIFIFENIIGNMHEPKEFRDILNDIFVKKIYDGKITIPGKKGKTKEVNLFNKSEFVDKKGMKVCPYCGRNYIYSVNKPKGDEKDGESVIKPEIDHFLPKSKYPYLAFSYYNLIPSCMTCNHSPCKHTKDPRGENMRTSIGDTICKIVNPYEIDVNSFKFQFDLINFNYFKLKDIKINFKFPSDYNIDSYQFFFGLENLYKNHNDLAHELILRKRFWSSCSSKKYYQNILGETEISSDFIQAYFGFFSNPYEYGKRPLSKFLHDISKHYDLIYKKGKKY